MNLLCVDICIHDNDLIYLGKMTASFLGRCAAPACTNRDVPKNLYDLSEHSRLEPNHKCDRHWFITQESSQHQEAAKRKRRRTNIRFLLRYWRTQQSRVCVESVGMH
jgi:hypothetical protein